MSTRHWKTILESLQIQRRPFAALPLPSTEQIEAFEKRCHFQLPFSYREFLKVFGPGQLGGDFQIRAPGYRVDGNSDVINAFNEQVDLEYLNHILRTVVYSGPENAEQVKRLWFFADTTGRDYIGWDPQDTRDAETREYGIYILYRVSGFGTIIRPSHWQLVFKILLITFVSGIVSSKYLLERMKLMDLIGLRFLSQLLISFNAFDCCTSQTIALFAVTSCPVTPRPLNPKLMELGNSVVAGWGKVTQGPPGSENRTRPRITLGHVLWPDAGSLRRKRNAKRGRGEGFFFR